MKHLLALIVGLALAIVASPAVAYVVEVTTSISLTTATDDEKLKQALESAINDVLDHAIAFTPTVVTVHKARMVGDRIYLLLLIADDEGETTMETFSTLPPAPREPAEPPRESTPRF